MMCVCECSRSIFTGGESVFFFFLYIYFWRNGYVFIIVITTFFSLLTPIRLDASPLPFHRRAVTGKHPRVPRAVSESTFALHIKRYDVKKPIVCELYMLLEMRDIDRRRRRRRFLRSQACCVVFNN